MENSKRRQVIELAKRVGVIRPRDLQALGLPREYLPHLCREGMLDRIGRGLYVAHDREPGEMQSYLEACQRVPHGVIALLSALRYHELTTQAPREVWMAISRGARRPHAPELPLRIVRFSDATLTAGVEEHEHDAVTVRVYSPAKTVADCFKYRNKIGIDVALEALRDALRKQMATTEDIWRFAKVCRVANVIRPYLEAM